MGGRSSFAGRSSHSADRRLLAGLLVGASALALTACSSSSASSSGSPASSGSGSSAKGGLIGVSMVSQQVARFVFEEKKIREIAAKNGDQVISNFSNNNLQTQISQIQSMMQRGIKVLVLNANDSKAFTPLIQQAQRQGIKVIAYDNDVDAKVDYVITRNNVAMGAQQAQSLLDHLPADHVAKVAIIRGDPATPAEGEMGQSYDKLIKNNPKVNVVYDVTTPGWDQASAQREAEAALQKEPNLDAFLCMWDNCAQAVAQALKSSGKPAGKVFSTGSDASPASLTYIAQGWQGQTTWTAYDAMAKDAADIAHAFITGAAPPKQDSTSKSGAPVINPPLFSVTKETLCEYINKYMPPGWTTTNQIFSGGAVNNCG
jgi:D-xylose transport system substrate-binding protein